MTRHRRQLGAVLGALLLLGTVDVCQARCVRATAVVPAASLACDGHATPDEAPRSGQRMARCHPSARAADPIPHESGIALRVLETPPAGPIPAAGSTGIRPGARTGAVTPPLRLHLHVHRLLI